MVSNTCANCGSQNVVVVRDADQHVMCLKCGAHEYRGERFTRRQWDEWIAADPELRKAHS